MKQQSWVAIVLCAVVLCFGLVACKSYGPCPMGKSPEDKAAWVVKRIASRLDLDDFQQGELERISQEIMEHRYNMESECEDVKDQALSMVRSDSIDRGELDEMVESQMDRMEDAVPFYLDKLVEFHSILTPEQREKVAGFMEKHRDRCRLRRAVEVSVTTFGNPESHTG